MIRIAGGSVDFWCILPQSVYGRNEKHAPPFATFKKKGTISPPGDDGRQTVCGDEALHFDEQVNGTVLDSGYVPDSLDQVSANVCAIGMIYSFYGRLSVSNNSVDDLRAGDIPPTFYTYGTEDPFYRQFIANANAARQAGVQVEEHVLEGWPHGFGVQGEWTSWFDNFLTQIISH